MDLALTSGCRADPAALVGTPVDGAVALHILTVPLLDRVGGVPWQQV
jgi:hypothetical protein